MNTYQELLALTAEECGELVQVCMKHLRKFEKKSEVDEKWQSKLIEEAGDVYCMLELLVEHGLVTNKQLEDRANVKREKLKVWSKLVD
jgi:NTP pyrophosphatase (non-canonical NTP hydrolase)